MNSNLRKKFISMVREERKGAKDYDILLGQMENSGIPFPNAYLNVVEGIIDDELKHGEELAEIVRFLDRWERG
jgi:hypothetical protein